MQKKTIPLITLNVADISQLIKSELLLSRASRHPLSLWDLSKRDLSAYKWFVAKSTSPGTLLHYCASINQMLYNDFSKKVIWLPSRIKPGSQSRQAQIISTRLQRHSMRGEDNKKAVKVPIEGEIVDVGTVVIYTVRREAAYPISPPLMQLLVEQLHNNTEGINQLGK